MTAYLPFAFLPGSVVERVNAFLAVLFWIFCALAAVSFFLVSLLRLCIAVSNWRRDVKALQAAEAASRTDATEESQSETGGTL